jgi:hypothetical protein
MKLIDAPELFDFLSTRHPPRRFGADAVLVHRGHVPLAAYMVFDGPVLRGKNHRRMGAVPKGALLGLDEILSKAPYDWHVHVKSGAQLSILDYTDLVQLHQIVASSGRQTSWPQEELQRLLMLPIAL